MPSKDKFEKSLLLTLESQVKGIKDTLSKLKKYDKNLVQINKNQKKVYETARAMGGILRTSAKAATVAIGGLGSILKRTSTIMLKFENSTINAEGAIKRLEKAYAGIKKSSQNALLSIQDIASALTDFQNTDIAKALLVRSEEFTKGFANVAEMLTEGVGPGVGKELLDNLLNTFKDQIPILEKIAKAGGTGIKKNLIDVLEKNQWSGGIEGANTVDKILRKLKADANRSDMTKSITTWNDAMSRFGTAIENLEAQFAKTFGPDVATQIERVSKYASELMNQFKEWGGINTLADKLGPIIKKIIDAVVWLTSTFLEAGITGKTAMIGLGIAISSINFRTLIKGTAGLIANIGKAGKVSSGLSEALGLMGIKFADALSGLKNFGKGIKVLMMDPYILAFAAAAGSIAILIYKINELNKTTESADKAINKTTENTLRYKNAIDKFKAKTPYEKALIRRKKLDIEIAQIGTKIDKKKNHWLFQGDTSGLEKRMAALGKERNEVSKYINTLKKSGANTKLNDTFTIKPQKNKIDKNKKDDKEKITATQKLADEIARLTSYKIELESLNTSMNSFRTIIDTLGPNAKIAGESVATIMDKKSKTQIEKGLEVIRKSRKAIFIAQQQLNKKGITPEERKNWQVALQAGTQQLGLATQTLNAGIENSLAPLEKQGDIIKSNSNLLEQQLEVSKAVYGTPALAVQAIQNLVQNKEKERQITLKQIAEQQQNIEIMRATGATEEQLAVQVQKKVDLQKKATEQQAQQLQLVKELRDGYIDAVRAQAFGAGMFSKILITQDQNLMRGLQQKAIKRNYLLGQYGEESAKTMAKSYRFSAQGMGLLETKKGQVLSPSGAKKLGDTRIEGIADPVARNAARQATNAALRITGGPQSSINTYTQRGLGGAGALGLGKGTNPAGQTAFGAAINRGADPRLKGTLTLTSVSSESSLNKQGAVLKDTFNKVGKFLESLLIEIGKQRADQMNMNESRIGATTNNQDN